MRRPISLTSMKNILLIVVCMIAVLGCDISKYIGGKNDNANAAKPTPTAEPKPSPTVNKHDYDEKPATPALSVTLKKFVGKYGYEVKLLDRPELRDRLKKLLGPDFAAMKANWNVETPIQIESGIFMASGCEQHNCGDNRYLIFVDLEKDNINVLHLENGTQTYAEHGKIILPKKFESEVE